MDKEALFRPRLAEAEVQLDGLGTVRVRGLNRAEAMEVQGASGLAAQERKIVAFGMLDPELTEAEVGQWAKAAPAGELERVSKAIAQLSGMLPGADKETYKSAGG